MYYFDRIMLFSCQYTVRIQLFYLGKSWESDGADFKEITSHSHIFSFGYDHNGPPTGIL